MAGDIGDIFKNFGNDIFDWMSGSDDGDQKIKDEVKKNKKNLDKGYTSGMESINASSNRFSQIVKKIVDITSSDIEKDKYKKGEFTSLEDIAGILTNKDTGNITVNPLEITKNIFGKGVEQFALQIENIRQLWRDINEETSLSGELSKDFRKEIMSAHPELLRMGISMQELNDGMVQLIKESGRFKLIDEDTMIDIGKSSKVFFENMEQAISSASEFENVSMGVKDAMKEIEEVGLTSFRLGLNAKETTKEITDNVSTLNQYGFENGIKGLGKMTMQAQRLKLDMKETFDLAEEVMDPTDALSLASNLQVIGGALGDFQDPIKMMWMATNNVEGLQDALIDTAESLASFDTETNTFKVMGADLRRARALSEQLGMSVGEIGNLAVQSAQKTSAMTDIMSSGIDMDEDQMEFLSNLAQMEDGRMVINIPEDLQKQFGETEVELRKLTTDQFQAFKQYQDEFKELSTEDLIEKQVDLITNIERDVSFLVASARVQGGESIQEIAEAMGYGDLKDIILNTSDEKINQATEKIEEYGEYAREKGVNVLEEGKKFFENTEKYYNEKIKNHNKSVNNQQQTQQQKSQPDKQRKTVELMLKSDIKDDAFRRMIYEAAMGRELKKGNFLEETIPE